MNITVYWRCILNTHKKSVAEQFYSEVEKLHTGIVFQKIDTYWKDSNLTEVEFTQSVVVQSTGSLIISLLTNMQLFSNIWNITIPDDLLDNYESFCGHANAGFKDSRINWMSISL